MKVYSIRIDARIIIAPDGTVILSIGSDIHNLKLDRAEAIISVAIGAFKEHI